MYGTQAATPVEVVQYVYPTGKHYLNAIAADAVLWTLGEGDETTAQWRECAFAMLTNPRAFATVTPLGLAVVADERVMLLTVQTI